MEENEKYARRLNILRCCSNQSTNDERVSAWEKVPLGRHRITSSVDNNLKIRNRMRLPRPLQLKNWISYTNLEKALPSRLQTTRPQWNLDSIRYPLLSTSNISRGPSLFGLLTTFPPLDFQHKWRVSRTRADLHDMDSIWTRSDNWIPAYYLLGSRTSQGGCIQL